MINPSIKYTSLRKAIYGWLIQFGVICVLINAFNIGAYAISLGKGEYYLRYVDGTYVTVWQYFLNNNIHDRDMLLLFIMLFFVECNYQFVFRKVKLPFFIISCLSLSVIFYFIFRILFWHEEIRLANLDANFLSLLFISGYALLYAFMRDYFYQMRHRKDLLLQQSRSELQALKAQLNPHFLFNSLNYLYGTALKEKATLTADGVDRLSQMMRYTITGMHHNLVSLSNEITFIEHYLALQRVRLPPSENIKINVRINAPAQDLDIAPLLLLPFIENAFKYGVSMDKPCVINIDIDLSGNMLSMRVLNQILAAHTDEGNKTGIKNTIKRLNLLYPGRHHLECKATASDYKVALTVNLHKLTEPLL